MSRILLIDSSGPVSSVGIAVDGVATQKIFSRPESQFSIHAAISRLAEEGLFSLQEIEAIAVTSGPGSYTGLRVGMAAAKGLCYSLGKKLILANTLETMARGLTLEKNDSADLLCPMIDARRDEVFLAIFDRHFKMILPPQPMILKEDSLHEWLEKHEILLTGSGAGKWASYSSQKVRISNREPDMLQGLATLAAEQYSAGNSADLMYSEPNYLKEFYNPVGRNL
jgi:tRNA threonylcarbamoyladenosine biosynthesis protein TsaB